MNNTTTRLTNGTDSVTVCFFELGYSLWRNSAGEEAVLDDAEVASRVAMLRSLGWK